jgi:O-antigen/teichoic acid export membrane protein
MGTDLQSNNRRIAKNTLLLYFRTIFTLLISLYSSRIVLNALGVEDFGIYNIVGGVVGMFTLLSGSMTAATQRFIAFELGKKNGNSNHVFSATLTIHIMIAILVIIIGESLGLWFLNQKLVISSSRMIAANWVYHFSLLTFVLNIISIPYIGLVVAHERLDAFAFISIGEAILKLVCILTLEYILTYSLILYAFYMCTIALIVRFFYWLFCKKAFTDSEYHFFRHSQVYRQVLSFTGWNFLGSTAGVLSNQGQNILINLFFGVVPNAARAVAAQIDNALNQFVSNFTMALNPQITKSYAADNKEYTLKLVSQGGKLCFFLFLCGAAPIMFCSSEIIELWLGQIPEFTVLFLRLSFIYILLTSTFRFSGCV